MDSMEGNVTRRRWLEQLRLREEYARLAAKGAVPGADDQAAAKVRVPEEWELFRWNREART